MNYSFSPDINSKLNTQRASSILDENQNIGVDKVSDKHTPIKGLITSSTNIKIKCNGKLVGMIQSFNVSENRNVNKLQSIGVEGVVQAVPGNTTGGSISAQRVALYGERIYDALGIEGWNGDSKKLFSTLKDQRLPFEIFVEINTPEGMPSYVEVYQDCWISSYKKSYTVQNVTVNEDVTIQYATVTNEDLDSTIVQR